MNKREIGRANRELIFELLAQVGYATTRQVAQYVWSRCDNSTRKMAGRMLRRLLADGHIVAKRDNDDINAEQLVALTKKGALEASGLNAHLPDGKVHARDYLRHAHRHRTACNSVFVALPVDWIVHSELYVRAKKAPIPSFEYHFEDAAVRKIPDLVAEHPDNTIEWFEVENTWRSDVDLAKAVAFMRTLFSQPGQEVDRVHFVITDKRATSIGQRLRARLTHGPESGWPRQVKELDARILAKHIRVSLLDSDSLTLRPVSF